MSVYNVKIDQECEAKKPIGIVDDCDIGNARQERYPYQPPIEASSLCVVPENRLTPDHGECDSELYVEKLERKNPEQPPDQILWTHSSNIHLVMLNHLPESDNFEAYRALTMTANLPSNPKNLLELNKISDCYQKTLLDESLLTFDSGKGDGRMLVLSTRRNIELLAASDTWFLDDIFKIRIS